MPNRINKLLFQEYTKFFGKAAAVFSIGYEGTTAVDVDKFRGKIEAGKYNVLFVKNRIANAAFKELGIENVISICKGGQAALLSTDEDPVALARFLVESAKEMSTLKLRGAVVEGTILDGKAVDSLSKGMSKNELKGKIVGQAMSPGANVAGAILGAGARIAGQLKSRIEDLEKSA